MKKTLKKIVVDLTPILPGGENGGAKIFVLELLGQLAKLAPETEFILLTKQASHQELEILDCRNVRRIMVLENTALLINNPRLEQLRLKLQNLPYLGRKLIALGCRINSKLKRRKTQSLLKNLKADLLFCPFTAPIYFEPEIPTVCTIYDLQYKTFPDFFTVEDRINRNHTFEEACLRASMLTAISEYSRQSSIQHGNLAPEKIRTIYLQMAQRILPQSDEDKTTLKRLNLKPQRYLLYPANFWKHKNHEMLLTAFGIACQEGQLPAEIKLVCTGAEHARRDFLIEASLKMNLKERIIFPGFISNTELATLMANSRAVIFPSLYEGFGLPLIEAMAAGVPVACSDCTSLPEIAANGALLFNPRIPSEIARALVALATNDSLRNQLIIAGQERAKLFSDASQMAKEYWTLFQDALKPTADALLGS